MAKYELSDQTVQNLMIFLNRVQITGVKEITAMLEILNALKPKEGYDGLNTETGEPRG